MSGALEFFVPLLFMLALIMVTAGFFLVALELAVSVAYWLFRPTPAAEVRKEVADEVDCFLFEAIDGELTPIPDESAGYSSKCDSMMGAIGALAWIRSESGPRSVPAVIGFLRRLCPYSFECLIAICLYERGLGGRPSSGFSGDRGVDGYAFRDGRAVLFQAKRWGSGIRSRDIESISRVAASVQAGSLFVHTGKTGRRARLAAMRFGVGLISGGSLVSLVLGEEFSIRWPMPTPQDNGRVGLPPHMHFVFVGESR